MADVGFGCANFSFAVYIENTPAMAAYKDLDNIKSMTTGEIQSIGLECGNGWRKVFNVYAKLLYALNRSQFSFACLAPTWQRYRDRHLLQQGSGTALLFSPPQLETNGSTLHIICGKTYAKQLLASGKLDAKLVWLDDQFAIDAQSKLIVCPYFDYRQLSNIKIERLACLLTQMR